MMNRTLLLGMIGLALAGCKVNNLVPLSEKGPVSLAYIDVDARFCTSDRSIAKQKMKYLFILDHSQSNQPGFPNPLTPNDAVNTDPIGARRYGPLVQFVNNLIPDPNNLTYFNLIDFNNAAYQPADLSTQGFIQDRNTFLNTYVKPDWIGAGDASNPAPVDQGFTNYQAALQLALQRIKEDAQAESLTANSSPVTIQYQIIFVTDGVPTVASGSSTVTQSFTIDIGPVIANLVGLKDDPTFASIISGVSLNTAYYYQTSAIPAAQSLLLQMANAGNGQYLEFAAGQGVMYQAFAPPARSIKMNLADIWIDNQNVVAWDDGRLLPDLDGDGLPDEIELKVGSNPAKADSDGNGVSDLVEYRTKGVPCRDSACAAANRDPYAICDGFAPQTNANGVVTFPASSKDGLNDCEKFVLGANRTNFDSNGDFIPDFLAFKNSIPFMPGTSGAFADPYGDSQNYYTKLKFGVPVKISQKNLLNFTPRQNVLLHEPADSADHECYHFTAKKVAVMRPGDVIRVYLIQNSSIITDKPTLKTVSKSWAGGDYTLSFSREEFN